MRDKFGQTEVRHSMLCVRLRRLEQALVEVVQTSLSAAWSPELRRRVEEIERDLKEDGGG